jgi:hypothetical protein
LTCLEGEPLSALSAMAASVASYDPDQGFHVDMVAQNVYGLESGFDHDEPARGRSAA